MAHKFKASPKCSVINEPDWFGSNSNILLTIYRKPVQTWSTKRGADSEIYSNGEHIASLPSVLSVRHSRHVSCDDNTTKEPVVFTRHRRPCQTTEQATAIETSNKTIMLYSNDLIPPISVQQIRCRRITTALCRNGRVTNWLTPNMKTLLNGSV